MALARLRQRRPTVVAWGCALVLAGCASGPDFERPAAPSAANYTPATVTDRTASAPVPLGAAQRLDPGAEIEEQWWRSLGSPRLDALVERAQRNSPTLASARATLAQARELHAARAGSSLYPQVEGGLSAQRQRASPTTFGSSAGAQEFGVYNASIAVSYQLDLAGGNRRALEALAARADYRRYELDAAKLALSGNVAVTAIAQARLADQIAYTRDIVTAQEEQFHLAGQRVRLGHAAPNEALAVQAQLEKTRADLHLLRKEHQHKQHLLATLVGAEPGEGGLPQFTLDDFALPAVLPILLPSELVRRRPDIRGAEALLKAANAEYGVAVAALYPQVTLSANAGSQALTAAALFGSGSAVWGLVAQLTQPLFKPGLAAEKRAALAAFDAAAANYQSVVLDSLRGVADVLRSVEQDAQALQSQATSAAAAHASLRLAQQRHVLGAASYLEVLDAFREAQQSSMLLAAAQARRLQDTVSLYVALGGAPAEELQRPSSQGPRSRARQL
ncbi:MAG TPA: efflux transporter outer membrane subunit [Ramlibacter sp.]